MLGHHPNRWQGGDIDQVKSNGGLGAQGLQVGLPRMVHGEHAGSRRQLVRPPAKIGEDVKSC